MSGEAQQDHDIAFTQMGIYRHYKGAHYLVIGIAHDANADSLYVNDPYGSVFSHHELLGTRTVVVYVPLELDGAHTGPRMAVRTIEDFRARVCTDPECIAYGQDLRLQCIPYAHGANRFTYVGPTWEPQS